MTPTLNLDEVTLASGSHSPSSGQMCVMDVAEYMVGEQWAVHYE